jgi:hypothetical protein
MSTEDDVVWLDANRKRCTINDVPYIISRAKPRVKTDRRAYMVQYRQTKKDAVRVLEGRVRAMTHVHTDTI